MVVVSEWLPNPVGSDAAGEWVELLNTGETAVSLSGWELKTSNGSAKLSGTIEAGAYRIFPRSATKLVLRNTDGSLSLYDSNGILVDRAEFFGAAPEGGSVNRQGELFLFADPTPGAPNESISKTALMESGVPVGSIIRHELGVSDVVLLALAVGIVLSALTTYAVKQHETFSHIFFKRNT